MAVFRTLLGGWECGVGNSLGGGRAETILTDCATAPVDLRCDPSIGGAAISLNCDADFELVIIRCIIDDGNPINCTLPYVLNLLDFSADEHTLSITVVDSRGMMDSYLLTFNGISELPALIIDFKVLENPLAPGSDISSRVIYLDETLPPSATISLDIISGVPIGPLPFRVLPLTYDEYEARFPSMSLDNLFPRRPIDPAGDSDINKTVVTFNGPTVFSPLPVIPDAIPELSEGFVYFLELDRANANPRDVDRIEFLNTHILAIIQDDDAIVNCEARVLGNVVSVSCPGIDGLPLDDGYQCSVDFATPESCLFPYEIARSDVPPGRHNLRLFQRAAGEPVPEEILGGTQFITEPLSIRFVNNTPIVGLDSVYAEFEINRPGVPMECHLTRLDNTRRDCSNGRYSLSGIPPGDFTLRVVAVDPFISDRSNRQRRAITRNRLWLHGDNEYCIVHLRNDGRPVNENTLTVDFYSTGAPSGFLCSVDRERLSDCSSPYVRENLPIGEHIIKIIPQGCGRMFRGYTRRFNVI